MLSENFGWCFQNLFLYKQRDSLKEKILKEISLYGFRATNRIFRLLLFSKLHSMRAEVSSG